LAIEDFRPFAPLVHQHADKVLLVALRLAVIKRLYRQEATEIACVQAMAEWRQEQPLAERLVRTARSTTALKTTIQQAVDGLRR